jgi:hypothetical protein
LAVKVLPGDLAAFVGALLERKELHLKMFAVGNRCNLWLE